MTTYWMTPSCWVTLTVSARARAPPTPRYPDRARARDCMFREGIAPTAVTSPACTPGRARVSAAHVVELSPRSIATVSRPAQSTVVPRGRVGSLTRT
ncbi:hypothetical protein CP975_03380 [Streptomyces alboniger]|uniref:Uncharacterized protein n=1 Tax=Streptomyces alboniger TaxID=132473 RepID=A0A5J6HBH7_STRAD|nr:hypothetical protein CP975_03380 [Streptomyces alboniger]